MKKNKLDRKEENDKKIRAQFLHFYSSQQG